MKSSKLLLKGFFQVQIRAFRFRKGITQEHAAECLGIAPRSYSDLEGGKYCPSATTLLFSLLAMTEEEVIMFLAAARLLLKEEL